MALPENIMLKILAIVFISIGLIIIIIAWFELGSGPSFGLDKHILKQAGFINTLEIPS